jgi:HlyD family type I secretion membrane fusion protein
MLHDCPSMHKWHRDVPRSARVPLVFGFGLLLAWGGGFAVWATTAPLASAVVATGSFVAIGQNKQVQHLEGGIIREMLVKEGTLVTQGQVLVRLDDTSAKSKLRRLELRKFRLVASSFRLRAEIASSDKLALPVSLLREANDPTMQAIIEAQQAELDARRASLLGQERVLRKEIAGFQEGIRGYQSQARASQSRLSLFEEELDAKRRLLEQQLIKRSEILALMRSEAGLTGEMGELSGRMGDANERIARAEQQIIQLRSTALQKALEELHAAISEADDIHEQIHAARDVVDRIEVRAPVTGVVVKINHFTPGGVVSPGGSILEIVPTSDDLLVEARVKPADITHVKEGQNALVRLTALNQRLTPMIEGTVTYVSADTVPEQNQRGAESDRRDSFIIRVRVDEPSLREKVENFHPTPGMPADLFIETGHRTFFNYLMRPVVDSMLRAFREH